MPLYYYRASDPAGNIIQGTLEAREESLVVLHLQQGGLIPLRISADQLTSQKQKGIFPEKQADSSAGGGSLYRGTGGPPESRPAPGPQFASP